MYRKVFKAEKEDDLRIRLPDEYLNKEVEVIAFEINKSQEPEPTDVAEALKFFDSIQIDMSNFKFDRDEANER